MASAATLSLLITGRNESKAAFRDLHGDIEQTESKASRLGGVLGGIGKFAIAGVAVGGAALVGLGTTATLAAADVAESQNKVNVVFGDSAGEIEDFADRAAVALGQSKGQALAAAGTFGNLFTTMGLGQEDAADMSQDILTLGSDLASFNNIDPTEALDKLRAGLVGEAEPLRALGVAINADMVETKAMEMGLVDLNGEVTEAGKVQARYALIMEQTKNAQGDFANTSDGMANASRIIQASFADMHVMLGEQILPVIAPLIAAFAKGLPGAIEALKPVLETIGSVVKNLAEGDFGAALDTIMGAVGDMLPKIQAKLGEWATAFVAWIAPMIPPFLVQLGEWGLQLLGWLGEQVPILVAKLGEWAAEFIAWIAPMLPPLATELGKMGNRILDWILEQVPILMTKLRTEWAPAFLNWVWKAGEDLLPALGEFMDTMSTWVFEVGIPKIVTIGFELAKGLLQGLGDGLGNLGEWLGEWLAGGNGNNGPAQGVDGMGYYATGGTVPGPVGAPQLAVVHGGETVLPYGTSLATSGGTTVVINVAGSVTSEHDLVETIRRGLEAHGRRNVSVGLA